MNGPDDVRVRPRARRDLDVGGDVVLRQAGEGDPRGDGFAHELGHRAAQPSSDRWIDVAIGAEQEQPRVRKFASDELKKKQ